MPTETAPILMFAQTPATPPGNAGAVPTAGAAPAPATAAPATTAAPSTHDTLGTGAPGGTTGGTIGAPGGAGGQGAGGGMGAILPLMLIMLVVMVGMSVLTSRRDKKKREQIMSSLGKNDRVLTVGGIIGHVAEVRDHEVVLITDKLSNARLHVTRQSIQQVLESANAPAASGGGDNGSTNGAANADVKIRARGDKATV